MRNTVGRSMQDAPKITEHAHRARGGPSDPAHRGMGMSPSEALDQLLTILTEPDHSPARKRLSPDLQKYNSSGASRRKNKRGG